MKAERRIEPKIEKPIALKLFLMFNLLALSFYAAASYIFDQTRRSAISAGDLASELSLWAFLDVFVMSALLLTIWVKAANGKNWAKYLSAFMAITISLRFVNSGFSLESMASISQFKGMPINTLLILYGGIVASLFIALIFLFSTPARAWFSGQPKLHYTAFESFSAKAFISFMVILTIAPYGIQAWRAQTTKQRLIKIEQLKNSIATTKALNKCNINAKLKYARDSIMNARKYSYPDILEKLDTIENLIVKNGIPATETDKYFAINYAYLEMKSEKCDVPQSLQDDFYAIFTPKPNAEANANLKQCNANAYYDEAKKDLATERNKPTYPAFEAEFITDILKEADNDTGAIMTTVWKEPDYRDEILTIWFQTKQREKNKCAQPDLPYARLTAIIAEYSYVHADTLFKDTKE